MNIIRRLQSLDVAPALALGLAMAGGGTLLELGSLIDSRLGVEETALLMGGGSAIIYTHLTWLVIAVHRQVARWFIVLVAAWVSATGTICICSNMLALRVPAGVLSVVALMLSLEIIRLTPRRYP